MTGQLISTRSGNTGDGLGQIYANGGTSNRIDLSAAGVGLPTVATRSTGTKLVLYPSVTATRTDYALGIDAGVLWSSIPENISTFLLRWYAGATAVAALTGTGNLTASTFAGILSGNASTATKLQTARSITNVAFDGSADVTVADGTKLPLVGGTLTGQLVSTRANDTANGGGQIFLHAADKKI